MDGILVPNAGPNRENRTVCDTLNRSYTQFHHAEYGGIPQAFVLNVLGASLLICLFSFLRRRAGDYARLALNHDTWNELFHENDVHLVDMPTEILLAPPVKAPETVTTPDTQAETADVNQNGVSKGVAEKKRGVFVLDRDDLNFRSIDADDLEDGGIGVYVAKQQPSPDVPKVDTIVEAKEPNNNKPSASIVTHPVHHVGVVGASHKARSKASIAAMHLANRSSRLLRLESPRIKDNGFFSWIMVTIRLTDAQYRERVGPDAVQYLTFQKYLIGVALAICSLSLVVILPVNLLGNNLDDRASTLAFTTISNLSNSSYLLWVPSIFSVIYVVLILGFMKHFTDNMPFKSQFETNAIMITNINILKSDHSPVTSDNIQSYLSSLYPDIRVEVSLAYNVQKLAKYLKKLECLSMALQYCEQYNLNHRQERLRLVPKRFGILASCFPEFICKTVDAQNYYQERVEKLQQKVDKQRKNIKTKPLGIAFVILPSFHTAIRVVEDFKLSGKRNFKRLPQQDLGAEFWNVKLSPTKKDIIWENLQNIGPKSFLRGCLVNFLYVILFIFVSSPAVLLAWFETFDRSTAGIQDKAIKKSSLLGFMIPPLLFVSVAVFMPYLIFLLDDLRSHWKMSTLNLRVMTKTYIYLLFMVVILPSVGLTSIYKFIDSVVLKSEQLRWDCIFLIDNGAFFTNYVITASLGGLCMELMRVCDLILYAFRLVMMKCKAERLAAIKNTLLEFPYGFMYAYQLTVMTTVISYSILCPLITPFGVVYMLVRHFVDRYNIYFSYAPSRISQNCHYRAVNFVILSSVVMLSTLLAFSWIRFGRNNGNTIFLLVCACILALFLVAKYVAQLLNSFTGSSEPSLSASRDHTLQQTIPETDPLTGENLGEITRFDCPFLTFKPTWLSRHATPTPKPSVDGKGTEMHGNGCVAVEGVSNVSHSKSFTFDIPAAVASSNSLGNPSSDNRSEVLSSQYRRYSNSFDFEGSPNLTSESANHLATNTSAENEGRTMEADVSSA